MSLEVKIVSSIFAVGIAVLAYYKIIKEYFIQKRMVNGKNYRKDSCKFEINDYINNKSYIKKSDWLKQNNKGEKLKKAIKIRDYANECQWRIDRKGI